MASVIAYSTDSAGMHPSHTLPLKLHAIAEAGISQVELGFPDLEAYAEQEFSDYKKLDDRGQGDIDKLVEAAGKIKALCEKLELNILVMHPFSQFEGYEDVDKRAKGFERAAAWFKVLKALNCQMIQVGSSDDPETSGDHEIIARDLRQLADEAAAQDPLIRIAYEMWAWGVHVNTWQHTWQICKLVERPNFGLCLDTFQICARAYADPTSLTGLLPSAQESLNASLSALSTTIPSSKIFYLQISDGTRTDASALRAAAEKQGIPPLYAYSNEWRPLPFMSEIEPGQKWDEYLPVVEVCEAVLKTGWRGPWSFEVFHKEDMAQDDPEVPKRWTCGAVKSYEKIMEKLKERGFVNRVYV
ncbi:hypothetical protein CERSUDRAFT_118976 [Gelatoporia subvermispora B]|uniref:Xylose isomerase-like TIM barrel domain-containing protein n=1 Tax=Ceriporiopsis subvermispora (strain B) TaxID=914234 RepID=M2Q622_CERS8|nr:hypothetical protein CERSUDRAFT_118976 [Gelatoporia subvermispora B]